MKITKSKKVNSANVENVKKYETGILKLRGLQTENVIKILDSIYDSALVIGYHNPHLTSEIKVICNLVDGLYAKL